MLQLYDVLIVCEKCKGLYDDHVERVTGKKKMEPFFESITKKDLGLKKAHHIVPISQKITREGNEGEGCRIRGLGYVRRNGAGNPNSPIDADILINVKNSEPLEYVGMQHPGLDKGVGLLMERPYLNAIEKFKEAAQGLGCGLPDECLSLPGTPHTPLPLDRTKRSVKCPRPKLSYSIGEISGCLSEHIKGKDVDYGKMGLRQKYTVLEVDCCRFCCNDTYKTEIIGSIRYFLNEGRPVRIREKVVLIIQQNRNSRSLCLFHSRFE